MHQGYEIRACEWLRSPTKSLEFMKIEERNNSRRKEVSAQCEPELPLPLEPAQSLLQGDCSPGQCCGAEMGPPRADAPIPLGPDPGDICSSRITLRGPVHFSKTSEGVNCNPK